MAKGKPLRIPRSRLEPLWNDPTLSLVDIAAHFDCSDRGVARYGQLYGLPHPRAYSNTATWKCDGCQHERHCQAIQATAARFPCQPAGAWDEGEMERRVDGDRVGSSNFDAVGVIMYSNKRAKGN